MKEEPLKNDNPPRYYSYPSTFYLHCSSPGNWDHTTLKEREKPKYRFNGTRKRR